MRSTRKRAAKTVYKEEDNSENEEAGDFSDSGSDVNLSEESVSTEDDFISDASSGGDSKEAKPQAIPRSKCSSLFLKKQAKTIGRKQKRVIEPVPINDEGDEDNNVAKPFFTVKDLTEEDKLLPSFLNLSESESSDEEAPSKSATKTTKFISNCGKNESDSEPENATVDNNMWQKNLQISEEVAKKTFEELEKQNLKIEEAKQSIQKYNKGKEETSMDLDVSDLLAQGEEAYDEPKPVKKPTKKKKGKKDDSDSEMEDWEEVNESKGIPQQGIQLIVDFPDACGRKQKKIDVEMMMKRKINRVKKEYQVYMHKVHVLCWIAHGNYVSKVLNDQEVLSAALKLVPSKECYPGERVDMKFVEQITAWFRDKLTLKQDKNEDKFKPKAPPLKEILLSQIKNKVVTSKKYLVFIFICILRAMGLQCRVMFNFVTVPIKPPSSELCSLSLKDKNAAKTETSKDQDKSKKPATKKAEKSISCKSKSKASIKQLDGQFDSESSDSDEDMMNCIVQSDGPSDPEPKSRTRRNARTKVADDKDVSAPKRSRTSLSLKSSTSSDSTEKKTKAWKSLSPETISPKDAINKKPIVNKSNKVMNEDNDEDVSPPKRRKQSDVQISPKPEESLNSRENRIVQTRNTKAKLKQNQKSVNSVEKSPRNKSSATPKDTPNATKKVAENMNEKSERTEPLAKRNLSSRSKKQSVPILNKPILNMECKKESVTVNSDQENLKSLEPTKTVEQKTRNRKSVSPSPKPNASDAKAPSLRRSKNSIVKDKADITNKNLENPQILITDVEGNTSTSSKYFAKDSGKKISLSRKISSTATPEDPHVVQTEEKPKTKSRTRSAPGAAEKTSKYFNSSGNLGDSSKNTSSRSRRTKQDIEEDKLRVSHRDLKAKELAKSRNKKVDVTGDLKEIIKQQVRTSKQEANSKLVKGKVKQESDDDSDFFPEETSPKRQNSDSDCDFKPTKISPKPLNSKKKIDRRVLSTDDERKDVQKNKVNVWCEVFVEELEQWISVDVIKARVHCTNELYAGATHPVTYVLGWDNRNFAKDLTRRYVPHWNTVTRKQRAEPAWFTKALQPWKGIPSARDREEDEQLDRMQMEAPLPKSIAEYKNHPLYALKRHLLKFEVIYPADAATLGFVRGEAVYARDCVYTCRSRDTWLKDAKVVRLGEKPYKIVKARPKWDRLSNKMINDIPLEVFGPWQVKDYEPPTAENGLVPRNAYGNVELFKACMLPKGTVHLKLPGLNKVAKKLNIDCAPAMTGFDFNGGFTHPVFDGFIVCEEFKDVITEAWEMDQEEQLRKENEKLEARVYGNWKKLIKGLFIRERLKLKYGFQEPEPPAQKNNAKGPRLVVKKR